MSSRIPPPLTDIGKFYKQIDDFKDKIITILSQLDRGHEIIEINKYYDKLALIKRANPRKAIELFYEHGVTAYITEILLRKDEFFIGKIEELEENPEIIADYEVNQSDLLFINQISGVWDHLQEPVKKNIWNYVQVICLLAEKVVGGNILALEKKRLIEIGLLK